MAISMYSASVPVFTTMLGNLSHFLDKAQANATARNFDVNVLVQYRLAPDMLPFSRQILIACDAAKLCVARISGVEAPKFEDTESTMAELQERIGKEGLTSDRGWSPQINTGAAVLIPEAYVPDLNVRLALYRRLSDAEKSGDREALAAELIDRFGPLPPEAAQLLKVVAIKGLCREANVAKIDVGPKGAVISFRNDTYKDPMGLVQFVQKNQVAWRIRPDQKVVVKGEWETPEQRLNAAEKILAELARLAG